MGLTFSMKIRNADDVFFRLRGFQRDLLDYTKVWPEVTKTIEAEEAWLFESRGASGAHGPWAPLTERYLERKYKKHGAQPIEVATGRLRRALTDSTSGDAIRRYQPLRMQFGTSLPYAVYQQTGWHPSHLGRYGMMGAAIDRMLGGTKKPRKKFAEAESWIEPRRVMDPTPELGTAIQRTVMVAVDNMARRAGFGRAKALGLGKLSPGAARGWGYGVLTGTFTGEGIS